MSVRSGRPIDEFLKAQQRFRQPGRKLGELPFFAHQPEEVRQEWLAAMGLEDGDGTSEAHARNGRAERVAERV